MQLLSDLEAHRDSDQRIRVRQPKACERGRLDQFALVADARFTGRHLELDASPDHTPQFHDDVEPARLADSGRGIDHFHSTARQSQRPPRLIERSLQSGEERVHAATDETIHILGGAGCRSEPMLEERAALEEEQLSSADIKSALYGGDCHGRSNQPPESTRLGFIPELAFGLCDPSIRHPGRGRLLHLRLQCSQQGSKARGDEFIIHDAPPTKPPACLVQHS